MLALLKKEMASSDDTTPLEVAAPKPVEWTPSAKGAKSAKRAGKNRKGTGKQ
jgi:hypothetical protein